MSPLLAQVSFEGLETVHSLESATPPAGEEPIARFVRLTEARHRIGTIQRQIFFMLDYTPGLLLLLQHIAEEAGEGLARQELARRVAGVLALMLDRLAGM